jgi:hypothetical protein
MSKRFLLKLSLSPFEIEPTKIAETFFPEMNYDKASLGCWFASIGEAVAARKKLKKINPRTVYDVYSHPDPWDEATDMRKDLLAKTMETNFDAPEPEEIDDDIAIHGDTDADPMDLLEKLNPLPILCGENAIIVAKSGMGQLMFVRNGVRIPVTCKEAESIAKISPSAICLYKSDNKTGSVEL